MKRFKRICAVFSLSAMCATTFAASEYNYLCGDDEGGCIPNKPGDTSPNLTCVCVSDTNTADVS
jgi:hypothetical protein